MVERLFRGAGLYSGISLAKAHFGICVAGTHVSFRLRRLVGFEVIVSSRRLLTLSYQRESDAPLEMDVYLLNEPFRIAQRNIHE
jgi:hypothetical protein